jgi:hypothetical protein
MRRVWACLVVVLASLLVASPASAARADEWHTRAGTAVAQFETEPGTTQWCVLGDQWLTEFDTFLTSATHVQIAQSAYYASHNAQVC